MNRKLIMFDRNEEINTGAIAHMVRKQHNITSEYPIELQDYYNIFQDVLGVRQDRSMGNYDRIPTMLKKMEQLPADLFCEGCLLLLFRCNHMFQQGDLIIHAMESKENLELDSQSLDWILKKVILALPITLAEKLGKLDKDAERFAKVKFEAFLETDKWEEAFNASLSIPSAHSSYMALEFLFKQTTLKAESSTHLHLKIANRLAELAKTMPNKDVAKEEYIKWQIQVLWLSGKEDDAYNYALKQKNRILRAYALALVGEAYAKSERVGDSDDPFIRADDIAFKLPQPEKDELLLKIATSKANGGLLGDAIEVMENLEEDDHLNELQHNIFKAQLDWKYPDIALHTVDYAFDIDEQDALLPQIISVSADMGNYPLALYAAGRIMEDHLKAYALQHLCVKMAGDELHDLAKQTFKMAYAALMDVGVEPIRTVIHNKVASSLVHLGDYQNAIGMVYLHDNNKSLVDGLKQVGKAFLEIGNNEMAFQTTFMALVNAYLDKLMDSPIEVASV